MKKILIIISVMFMLSSCSKIVNLDADEACSKVIKEEQNHLNRYIHIKKICKDSTTIEYVNELITNLKKDAYKTSGIIESRESFLIPLNKSKELLKVYIDSCENN